MPPKLCCDCDWPLSKPTARYCTNPNERHLQWEDTPPKDQKTTPPKDQKTTPPKDQKDRHTDDEDANNDDVIIIGSSAGWRKSVKEAKKKQESGGQITLAFAVLGER